MHLSGQITTMCSSERQSTKGFIRSNRGQGFWTALLATPEEQLRKSVSLNSILERKMLNEDLCVEYQRFMN